MEEKKRRELLFYGAILWALTPICLAFLMSVTEHISWLFLLPGQIFLIVAVTNWKRYLVLVSMAACLVLVLQSSADSFSFYSIDFLFCLWIANAGTLLALRGESTRTGVVKAAQSYSTALVFITLFLLGEIIFGQLNESYHRLTDIGYIAYVARAVGLFAFGPGCWVYCIMGALHLNSASQPSDTVSGGESLTL